MLKIRAKIVVPAANLASSPNNNTRAGTIIVPPANPTMDKIEGEAAASIASSIAMLISMLFALQPT